MKYVDILSAQNVEISFQLASPTQRIFAFLLDLLFMVVIALLIFWFVSIIDADEEILLLLYIPTLFCYSIMSEVFLNGQSLGKKILKLKVIKLIGGEPHFFDYVIRWVFKPVDIWFSGGSIATILCVSSLKNQRLGDILAGTTVVRNINESQFYLKDISNNARIEGYIPVYPEAIHLNEEQVVLIKETLEKSVIYKNVAHNLAVKELSNRVAAHLQLQEINESRESFLRNIIRDYVQLTR